MYRSGPHAEPPRPRERPGGRANLKEQADVNHDTGTEGHLHEATFKGHPAVAADVRAWAAVHVGHPDAPAVANELFVAILGSGANTIDMQLATAAHRLRITAAGPGPLLLRHSHGPGWRIIEGLSRTTGVTTDEHGLWAHMEQP